MKFRYILIQRWDGTFYVKEVRSDSSLFGLNIGGIERGVVLQEYKSKYVAEKEADRLNSCVIVHEL